MKQEPSFPFDLTGYTCFSVINCPLDQAVRLLNEYPGLCAQEDPAPYPFRLAALPEQPQWTLLRWPRPGRFYDLMNLTMWLMGYKAGLGGENPIFIAVPPEARAGEGPLLARPDYDSPFGDMMLGFWQGWSFDYTIPGERLRWIGADAFPQEYFFYGRGYSMTGFRLEWLENPERIPDWTEICVTLEAV